MLLYFFIVPPTLYPLFSSYRTSIRWMWKFYEYLKLLTLSITFILLCTVLWEIVQFNIPVN